MVMAEILNLAFFLRNTLVLKMTYLFWIQLAKEWFVSKNSQSRMTLVALKSYFNTQLPWKVMLRVMTASNELYVALSPPVIGGKVQALSTTHWFLTHL